MTRRPNGQFRAHYCQSRRHGGRVGKVLALLQARLRPSKESIQNEALERHRKTSTDVSHHPRFVLYNVTLARCFQGHVGRVGKPQGKDETDGHGMGQAKVNGKCHQHESAPLSEIRNGAEIWRHPTPAAAGAKAATETAA